MVQTTTERPTTTKKEERDIISLRQFNNRIPDEAAAIAFTEARRWGDTPCCPRCHQEDTVYRVKNGRPMSHRCRSCRRYFSVRTGTVMAETNLPVRTWLLAMHLIHGARKGISAMQLHKLLGVDYRTAWFLGHRIREFMKQDQGDVALGGTIQVDETYIGGKEKNKHAFKKGSPMSNKFAVFGLRTHEGKVVAFPVSGTDAWTLQGAVLDNVEPGATVYTDGHPAYGILSKFGYNHQWVNHSVGQYVNWLATTNGIESFWALLKRGYVGTFHWMSWKHLHRYVTEFAFRYNAGPGNGFRTIGIGIKKMEGKRVTFKELVAKE